MYGHVRYRLQVLHSYAFEGSVSIKYQYFNRNITNIDVSQVVINQMLEMNRKDRPGMKFLQLDACNMTAFEDNKFSVVLDKGTLDAIMPDGDQSTQDFVRKYWCEIGRVLRIGGRYICISLLQKHIIEALLNFFPTNNWMFRVVRCIEAETKTSETSSDGTSLPVFMIIATKFQKLPSPVLEYCMAGDKMMRVNATEEISEATTSVQKAAMVCNGLHRGNIAGRCLFVIIDYKQTIILAWLSLLFQT